VNRALRAATMGVLLLSPVALSACSAGQVTQTATQERDKTGAQAEVGDIAIREAKLAAPSGGGGYESGDDADLQVAFVNRGDKADTLTGVDAKGFASAEIANTASRISSTTGSTAATDQIKIPAGGAVFVGQQNSDYTITLSGLDDSLNTGQYVEVTFTFENAGDVTLPITVANPPRTEERGKAYDFNKDRKATGEG